MASPIELGKAEGHDSPSPSGPLARLSTSLTEPFVNPDADSSAGFGVSASVISVWRDRSEASRDTWSNGLPIIALAWSALARTAPSSRTFSLNRSSRSPSRLVSLLTKANRMLVFNVCGDDDRGVHGSVGESEVQFLLADVARHREREVEPGQVCRW